MHVEKKESQKKTPDRGKTGIKDASPLGKKKKERNGSAEREKKKKKVKQVSSETGATYYKKSHPTQNETGFP